MEDRWGVGIGVGLCENRQNAAWIIYNYVKQPLAQLDL